MSDFKVSFDKSDSPFKPVMKLEADDWFDTSYAEAQKAIGELRFPIVSNGRYERKHPILSTSGETMGYLVGAEVDIGYTWKCVYAGGYFWLTNQTFSSTTGGGGTNISVIADVGNILFSSKRKFRLIKTFDFKENSWKSPDAFKLLDEGRQLFVLTHHGFCLFDTHYIRIESQALFNSYPSKYDFTISPKVPILAVVCSFDGKKDPIDGEYQYSNAIWLYNLETGKLVGEISLNNNEPNNWSINFSEDGRTIRATTGKEIHQFELNAI